MKRTENMLFAHLVQALSMTLEKLPQKIIHIKRDGIAMDVIF